MIRRLTEYLFFDESKRQLQLDVPKMLHAMNLPDTPVTREQATETAMQVFRELYPDVTQDVNTMEYGTKRVYNPTRKTG